MLAGTVCQFCQPPLLPKSISARTGPPALSMRARMAPLTPAAAPEASRATNWFGEAEPKSMAEYFSQSPLAIQPTSTPPPESLHDSFWVPLCALNDSAWMVEYALVPPPPPPPPPAPGPSDTV